MHLLLETALGDSQHYDLLTPDELDDLKQEEHLLSKKIQGRRKKLFLETRMQTASRSLQRLNSHSSHGSTGQNNHLSPQKCDDLAEDIWRLERRQAELKDKRLKHTAGVLQLNHQLQLQNGDLPRHLEDYDDAQDDFNFLDGAFDLPAASGHITPRLQEVSGSLYNMISTSNVHKNLEFPEPPSPGGSAEDELEYIEHGLNTIKGLYEGLLKYLDQNHQKSRDLDQTSQQTNAVLGGLWEIIGSSEEDLRRNVQSSDDASADASHTSSEPFSLQAFSTKVQALCANAATLSDAQRALQQQYQEEKAAHQQKTAERSQLLSQLQETHDAHLTSQRSLEDHKAQLMDVKGQRAQAQQEIAFMKQQIDERSSTADDRQRQLSRLGNEREDMDAQLAVLSVNFEAAQHRADESDKLVEAKTRAMDAANVERQALETELVRLQTELTVSRAELDGAYGTRAQRAAEGAMTPEVKREIDTLKGALEGKEARMEALERELGELVGAHEGMVRQLVEAEKEREALEGVVDAARERVETLERGVSDEKVRGMGLGVNLGSGENGALSPMLSSRPGTARSERGGDSTSVGVMRNEFKRMVREMRAEHFRTLKVCCCCYSPSFHNCVPSAQTNIKSRPNKMSDAVSRRRSAHCVEMARVPRIRLLCRRLESRA